MENPTKRLHFIYKVEKETKSFTYYKLENHIETVLTETIRIPKKTGGYLQLIDDNETISYKLGSVGPTFRKDISYLKVDANSPIGNEADTLITLFLDSFQEALIIDVYWNYYESNEINSIISVY